MLQQLDTRRAKPLGFQEGQKLGALRIVISAQNAGGENYVIFSSRGGIMFGSHGLHFVGNVIIRRLVVLHQT